MRYLQSLHSPPPPPSLPQIVEVRSVSLTHLEFVGIHAFFWLHLKYCGTFYLHWMDCGIVLYSWVVWKYLLPILEKLQRRNNTYVQYLQKDFFYEPSEVILHWLPTSIMKAMTVSPLFTATGRKKLLLIFEYRGCLAGKIENLIHSCQPELEKDLRSLFENFHLRYRRIAIPVQSGHSFIKCFGTEMLSTRRLILSLRSIPFLFRIWLR